MEAGLLALWRRERIVPVVVLDDVRQAAPLAAALMAGGLHSIEVTLRTEAALAAIAVMAKMPELTVGAGTVLNVAQAAAAVAAGARFIVSPGFDAATVAWCQQQQIPVVPGCATATEIQMALMAGLSVVKFFPAELLGGVPMLQALAAVFPQLSFMPTGGISPVNIANYLVRPEVVACGGSWLAAREMLEAADWAGITASAADACRLVKKGGAAS